MTSEEKLKELYESEKKYYEMSTGANLTYKSGKPILAKHIDLIADLVVERLKNGTLQKEEA